MDYFSIILYTAYIQKYDEDFVFSSVEDVAVMFQFLKFPMPDPQDESHFKLQDLVGKKFSDLPFSKPNDDKLFVTLSALSNQNEEVEDSEIVIQPIERDNVKKFTQRINEATTIQIVEAIMKEDKEGGERVTVQRAGQSRIDILKISPEETDNKKKLKNEEFPQINWTKFADPQIQLCILLYDDRVNTYHRLQEIDVIIDDQTELALEFVHLDIRNQQAHKELQSFNDTGDFKYIHPLTVNTRYKRTQRDELIQLKKEKPEASLNEITNCNQNIRRVGSNIKKKKYKDEAELQAWEENLERAKIKRQIIIELM